MDESKSTLKTKASLENNGKGDNTEDVLKKKKTKKSHAPFILLALLMIAFFYAR